MKNKGFTLIEMLATIAIIGILAVMLVPMILEIRQNILEKTFISVKSRILDASKDYLYDNLENNTLIKTESQCQDPDTNGIIFVNTLIEKNYLKSDSDDNQGINNPLDGTKINKKICLYYDNPTNFQKRKIVACIKIDGRSSVECE